MYRKVTGNYSEICRSAALSEQDVNTSIAIIDSVYKPSEEIQEKFRINVIEDFVGRPNIDDTTGHGKGVGSILFGGARNAEFSFYRVIRETGKVLQRDLLKAIHTAHNRDEVDLINLSLGFDHSQGDVSCDMPNEPCKVRFAVKQAVKDGSTVVAAAGNSDETDDEMNDGAVCCPALLNEVISVGGMVPICTATPKNIDQPVGLGPSKRHLPPFACWVKRKDSEEEGAPICSGLGCSPTETCEDNRVIWEWRGNVDHDPSEIDVLAPAAYPIENTKWEPDITVGTSYAAPFVSAQVSEMIAFLKLNDVEVEPSQIQAALTNTAKPVEEGSGRYLQGNEAMKRIAERKGLRANLTRRPDDYSL